MHVFDALLIDMDGTLVDSAAVTESVWRSFCSEYRVDPDDLLPRTHGTQTLGVVSRYLGDTAEAREVSEALERRAAEMTQGIRAFEGAAELLAALPKGSWALVTSASRALAESRMALAGLPMPEVSVCAEDITPGKPRPGCYRLAAKLLGVDVAACAVLEDAPAGIEAGVSAGAQVFNVGPHIYAASHKVVQVRGLDRLHAEMQSGKIGLIVD